MNSSLLTLVALGAIPFDPMVFGIVFTIALGLCVLIISLFCVLHFIGLLYSVARAWWRTSRN